MGHRTRPGPFNFTPVGANPISPGSPHVRPMWALSTCGGPDVIKKNTHPKYITALVRDQGTTRRGLPRPRVVRERLGEAESKSGVEFSRFCSFISVYAPPPQRGCIVRGDQQRRINDVVATDWLLNGLRQVPDAAAERAGAPLALYYPSTHGKGVKWGKGGRVGERKLVLVLSGHAAAEPAGARLGRESV